MIKNIILGEKQIQYDLIRKNVKNINLRIKSDRSIFVSANATVPQEVIDEFLISKANYILKALAYYEDLARYAPQPKQYVDGESFKVLGRELRLKVLSGTKNSISCDEAYITLIVKDVDDVQLKKKLTDKWLHSICIDNVKSVCESIYPKFQKYGISYPEIRFRHMISRWGSCQPKRKLLTFNYALVESPISCIEYVVAHEFTHFLQPNHSRKFYQQLAMFMPDWEGRKNLLEKEGQYSI